jgi:DNA replication and repair protein RecF
LRRSDHSIAPADITQRDTAHTSAAWLSRLTLTDFRNYARAAILAGPGPVVVTGLNGAGKTNMLEAVSLLSQGRGLRAVPFAELTRLGAGDDAPGWAVAARLQTQDGERHIGTGLTGTLRGAETSARAVRIDGRPAAPGALGKHLRIVWLTPAMHGLFTGPAADRRRFLDRMIETHDPSFRRLAGRFERAMRQRNRLLEEGGSLSLLHALEMQMTESGVALAAGRLQFLEQLAGIIERKWGQPAAHAFPAPQLALEGRLEAALAAQPAVDVEDAYAHELAASRDRDRAAGRTLIGPHRSDLLVFLRDKQMPARHCSTGEQKALLVGLIFAHAELVRQSWGAPPLILLDEIAAHLDEARRAALFAQIEALSAQAWLTGTDRSAFSALDGTAQFFVARDGTIEPEHTQMC